MRTPSLGRVPWAIGVVATALLTACATTKDVKRAIALSNAALVTPYLERPEVDQEGGWEQAVRTLDRLVAENADQPVLTNHLRVRAAILLTVNGQANLAEEYWSVVDSTRLETERDRALYGSRTTLVWFYPIAARSDPLSPSDPEIDRAIVQLDNTTEGIDHRETEVFLETVRAMIVLKRENPIDTSRDPDIRENVQRNLSEGLLTFVCAFPAEDLEWAWRNPSGAPPGEPLAVGIPRFRHRSWLHDIVQEYLNVARDKGLTPDWEPDWIASTDKPDDDATFPGLPDCR